MNESQIPNRLIPTLANSYVPESMGNESGTVLHSSSLHCSCGPKWKAGCPDHQLVSVAVSSVSDVCEKSNNRHYGNVLLQLPK